jgi:NADPH-dependent 2,4-dienoyl-CoA reductase/sulfur reductase-like enzyme
MTHYQYLIIGGGMTAHAAARGIRDVDARGTIGIIGAEPVPPYKRPPLSKGLWKGQALEKIWYNMDALAVDLHVGRTAELLEPGGKRVVDSGDGEYTYERLLIATGATPRRFPFGQGINYFRTAEDYRRLREGAERGQRFAVIGGGFIGSELAAALSMNGKEVVMAFPDKGIGWRIFPADLSLSLNAYYKEKGVEIRAGVTAAAVERSGTRFEVTTRDVEGGGSRTITADGVVAGVGVEPNVGLAQQAGLQVANGIVVDEFLHTSAPDIYAAGDVAFFANPTLGTRMRVEHEDNARTMGRTAGWNMAGEPKPYDHLPFFYSDMFDLGYEAVGELDARLETFSDWTEPYRDGVVYYLRDGRVRGVLLWNVWKQVDAARRLIAEPGPFEPADLKGRLPEDKR